ncbi:FkbM family methyltransferase [Accumulibacter sp.]|uniref:FkbM family methyltransferase n=1 Tax=Accumulibacter sp. TaxID=2053492 RepID=UPI0025ED16D4|nr:FkbM family methyltransferase [Accumulibacter sp.]MCM8612499.1 FkbM family methyltransferase [Accumulibacter sp.]MCM8636392.1 FkbM family methyltransferase [Accumulibacter sp.]MCM8640078.1 FkbM family methyltransferase [Accumulibacter sp.]
MIEKVVKKIREIREIIDHPTNRERRFAGLFRYVRWNIGRRLLNEADYAIQLAPAVQVIVSNQENYATLVYTCRLYDFQEMQFILHYLRPGDVFGDFGSNVGVYSVIAGSTGASVLAVEPVPDTHARLIRNLRLNSVRGKAVRCGLSDSKGTLRFTSRLGGMNRVATARDVDAIEVEVTNADALVAETGLQPVVIKIDVEGFELPLLRGASRLLQNAVAIIIELNGSGAIYGRTDNEVHELLVEAGFGCFEYATETRDLKALDTYRRDQFNTLYIKRDRVNAVRSRIQEAVAKLHEQPIDTLNEA